KPGGKLPPCHGRKVASAVAAAEEVGKGDEEDGKTNERAFLILCAFNF
ncbi:hypothetical protein L195_g061742, partial [Trifolium pratense]